MRHRFGSQRIDSRGWFHYRSLGPDLYDLSFNRSSDDPNNLDTRILFDLGQSEAKNINLDNALGSSSLFGRALYQGQGVKAWIKLTTYPPQWDSIIFSTFSDPDGQYRIEQLPLGSYSVYTSVQGEVNAQLKTKIEVSGDTPLDLVLEE